MLQANGKAVAARSLSGPARTMRHDSASDAIVVEARLLTA
jgi:hypothetical protein